SAGYGVNDAGDVTGHYYVLAEVQRAFRFTSEGFADIGRSGCEYQSYGTAINNSDACSGTTESPITIFAFEGDADSTLPLDDNFSGIGLGICDAGIVAGIVYTGSESA